MAKTVVDAKRDIWQALINEAAGSESLPRANDKHFLFVGPEQCGKSALLNGFYARGDEPPATLALSYQSCSLHAQETEHVVHFWELGGGQRLEQILGSVVTSATQQNFVIFICFNLSRAQSICEAIDLLPPVMRRFKSGYLAAFLVANYYDEFEDKDPSYKLKILRGLRAIGRQFGAGVLTHSSKRDPLIARFRTLVKSLVISDIRRPDPVTAHTMPVLVYHGQDDEAGGSEVAGPFIAFIRGEAAKEEKQGTQGAADPGKDPIFKEEDVDKEVEARERDLEDKLRVLRASITD